MKTLMLFGLMLLSATTAQSQYFQRHVDSRFEMNYRDTITRFSSFKSMLPVFTQLTLALDSGSVQNSKNEISQEGVLKSSSLEKAIQYRREHKKRKIDLSPVLHILYTIYEANITSLNSF